MSEEDPVLVIQNDISTLEALRESLLAQLVQCDIDLQRKRTLLNAFATIQTDPEYYGPLCLTAINQIYTPPEDPPA
jgi:hypothetical protein